MTNIAIIGGTGLYDLPSINFIEKPECQEERVEIDTPYGNPSAAIRCCRLADNTVYFLSRHGEDHKLPPHQINYRANISALAQLGVTTILALHTVGGINPLFGVGDIVIPDQLIDYTHGREHTFFDALDNAMGHCDFTYPFSPALIRQLERVVSGSPEFANKVHIGGCYAVMQGPRLETAAEINRLERDGCDIVGMTAMPEAALAREKNIEYASLSMVVNPAAGRSDGEIIIDEIMQALQITTQSALGLVMGYLKSIG